MAKFNLKVVTPICTQFEGEVDMVILPGLQGELAIMRDHMPLVVALSYGLLTIRSEGEDTVASVYGGLAEVVDNNVVLAVPYFELPNEIDKARAQIHLERAERALQDATTNVERRRAELSIRRNNVRLEVSSYAVIKGRVSSG
jgi:F-type H+-transporting ATPase subunit epsilon